MTTISSDKCVDAWKVSITSLMLPFLIEIGFFNLT